MDLLAWAGLAPAGATTLLGLASARTGRTRHAVAWLALTALCLTAPLSWRFELSPWDERYHALVAKNVAEGSLLPLLVAHPVDESAPPDWRSSHTFLHKPPLAFWLMGAARAVFGPSEVAIRVPSWLAQGLLVAIVFALARRFVSEPAAIAAAAFAAWNGRLALVASGLRATDHVDALFTFAVALGALAALRAVEALAGERPRAGLEVAGVGLATGAAYLTKDLPAGVVIAFFALALGLRPGLAWSRRLLAPAAALAVAAVLVLPWELRAWIQLPAETGAARQVAREHLRHVVEAHAGPWWFHLERLPRDFGPLAPLVLVLFFVHALARAPARLALVGWFVAVYGAFALAASKMEAYVQIAAPVVFVACGWFVCDALGRGAALGLRIAHRIACVGLAAGALVGVWRALDPVEPRVRDPLWARELRYLASEVAKLPGPKRAVFGVRWPTECMFYAPATCVAAPADGVRLERARQLGFSVAEYGVGIAFDPRTLPARELAAKLAELGARRVVVFNALDAADLEKYLGRFQRRTIVSAELPQKGRRLARALAHGARVVVLVAPGQRDPGKLRGEFADAVLIESAHYARPRE